MAACTGKYAARMETLMKAYKFDDKEPITILSILADFKRACDSNGVFEGIALWLLPAFIRDKPAFSLTVWMASHEDDEATHRPPKAGEKQMTTFVEHNKFLLKFYATD